MTTFLNSLGVDRDVLIVIFSVLVIILIAVFVATYVKLREVLGRYETFMSGRNAASLEDRISDIYEKSFTLQNQDMEQRDYIKTLTKTMAGSYCKTGIVKYNAFNGMGGQSSFVIALLDHTNTGFLINTMHSRTSCFLYVKEIKNGKPDSAFSEEEQEALEKAMND